MKIGYSKSKMSMSKNIENLEIDLNGKLSKKEYEKGIYL